MYIYYYTLYLCTVGLVSALDDIVGETIQSLKDAGMYNNSVIVFTSDVSNALLLSDNEQYVQRITKVSPRPTFILCITAATFIAWSLKASKSYLIKSYYPKSGR